MYTRAQWYAYVHTSTVTKYINISLATFRDNIYKRAKNCTVKIHSPKVKTMVMCKTSENDATKPRAHSLELG